MTAYAASGLYTPHGLSESNVVYVKAVTSDAMSNTDTMAISLPAHVDKNIAPLAMKAYTVSSGVYTSVPAADLVITTYTTSTGVTVLTAGSGGVASGAVIFLIFGPQ